MNGPGAQPNTENLPNADLAIKQAQIKQQMLDGWTVFNSIGLGLWRVLAILILVDIWECSNRYPLWFIVCAFLSAWLAFSLSSKNG